MLDANDAMIATSGYTRDELLGMPITRLLPPEDVPALLRVIRETVRPGRSPYRPPTLWRHVYKSGEIRDVEVAAHDYDLDGRDAVLVTVADVTDRLRAERERDALLARLRQEVAQKAAIIEQMMDAVIVADASGRVVLANRAGHDLFDFHGDEWPRLGYGTPPLKTLPWTLYDVLGNELAPPDRPFARAMRGETARIEVRIVTASGRESWVSVTAGPLRDEQGQLTGVVWLGRETTEERTRREREARGEKLRALGQMASGVAHDLNQYLGLVAGYGDLTIRALDQTAPNLGAARDALDVVVRAAMDGSESVKRLLAFARPAQDGAAETVEVGELLREVAVLTAPRWRDAAQQRGGPIAMTLEIVGDTTVKGWPSALREALTNLVFNAVDAVPHGGTIHLAAEQQGDRVARQRVRHGRSGSRRRRCSTSSSRSSRPRAIGGPAWGWRSSTGSWSATRGSSRSPRRRAAARRSRCHCRPPRWGHRPRRRSAPRRPRRPDSRILVVDDEPTITRMVAMMLGPHGHDLTLASSGEEALDRLAEAGSFDLILSDLGLGDGMNGWDLLDRVRETAPGTRFILSTGWGAQIDPADVVGRGGEGLLAKPYRLTDLLHAIAGPA